MELGLAYAEVEWAYNSVGPTDSKLLETRCGGRLGGIGIFSTAKKPHPFKAQSLFERYSPRSYSITNSGSRAREFAGFADGFSGAFSGSLGAAARKPSSERSARLSRRFPGLVA